MTLVQECQYEPAHVHEYPDDWLFGGPTGNDPRSDSRFQPNVYIYFDEKLTILHTTTVPICHDEAIDKFTEVAGYGPGFYPKWIQVRYPDRSTERLPVEYDWQIDEVTDG